MLKIKNYQLNKKIYQSNTIIIYRGQQKNKQKAVILKILKQPYPSPKQIAWFKREYEITRSLNPASKSTVALNGVVAAYQLLQVEEKWIMVLEDFGGDSLIQLNLAGQLSIINFLNHAINITKILGQVHQRDIIHKDINPANIVLNPNTNQIKLIDFGIATPLLQEETTIHTPNALEGTLAYISPEQTGRMNRNIDYRTDFYSLGATFYHLLTGQLPFASNDAMELVHSHIAKQPPPITQFKPQVPAIINKIIMKLMAKNAEERYQSALGLQHDLEQCLNYLKNKPNANKLTTINFELGRHDFSDTFQIPQILYGRENELKTLLSTFEQINSPSPNNLSTTNSNLLLVTGEAGVGKSALVYELHKSITNKQGCFVSGKYNHLQHNIPYLALSQAFNQFCRYLLTKNQNNLAKWQDKILKVVGSNGQILIDIIPDLALVIGPQPNVPPLDSQESQNRLNFVFQNFVKAICTVEHPLVLFLDNLQWVDDASLNLLETMLTDNSIKHLLLIGAYRDDEIEASHSLLATLDTIKKATIPIKTIKLSNLSLSALSKLISNTLNTPHIADLATLVYKKTGGNAFFCIEFLKSLYKENLLSFNITHQKWEWNTQQIKNKQASANIIDLLTQKISNLPHTTQTLLSLAACIGNQFDLKTLSSISQKSALETLPQLWEAITEGLIIPLDEQYKLLITNIEDIIKTASFKFAHSRIQQVAYNHLEAPKKTTYHLQIGRLLLANTTPQTLSENIFNIVYHLNLGYPLIDTPDEQIQVIGLNLQAGQQAKAATAYQNAYQYLNTALSKLNETHWQSHYQLTFSLHKEVAQAAFIIKHFSQANELYRLMLANVQSKLDKTSIYLIQIAQYQVQHKHQQALQIAKKGLALFDIIIPSTEEDAAGRLKENSKQISIYLNTHKIKNLIDVPLNNDPIYQAQMKLLTNLTILSYFLNRPTLSAWTSSKMTNLSLQLGPNELSSYAYVHYGFMLCAQLNNYTLGYKFGKLGIALAEQFNNPILKGRAYFLFAVSILPWQKAIKKSIPYLKKAYKYHLEGGAIVYAVYAAQMLCRYQLLQNSNLLKVYHNQQSYCLFIKRHMPTYFQGLTKVALLEPLHQLLDQVPYPAPYQDEQFDEQAYLATFKNSLSMVTRFYQTKIQLLYYFEQYNHIIPLLPHVESIALTAAGQAIVPETYFFVSLALTALYKEANEAEQQNYQAIIACYQEQMQAWAAQCPVNYQHQYLLVEAERARLNNNTDQAIKLYDQATETAKTNQYPNHQAIANELQAKFWLSKNKKDVATLYMNKAYTLYTLWHATAKVKHLEKTYPQLLTHAIQQNTYSPIQTLTAPKTTMNHYNQLDLTTLIKASQIISGDIVLNSLLETMMKIVIENAGADNGSLLLEQQNSWFIEAKSTIKQSNLSILESIPLTATDDDDIPILPVNLIQYIIRTQKNIILNNPAQQSEFSHDPYFIHNQTKSVCCIPLIHHGDLIGLLYLENNLTVGAFTPAKLEVLQLLSTQIAISIENARLYTTLARKEQRYRTLFEDSHDTIFITNPQGQILDTNSAGVNLFGYSKAELKQIKAKTIYTNPDDRLKFQEVIEKQGMVKDFEVKLRTKSGTNLDCLVTATLRRNQEGDIISYEGIIRDITQHKQAEREHQQLSVIQNQLNIAQKIQQSLLPPSKPKWHNVDAIFYTTPAYEIGGDFYAYQGSEQAKVLLNKYIIAVGDVSGKGISAALLMATCLSRLEASLSLQLTPTERLIYLDRVLTPYTKPRGQNCALCYLEIIGANTVRPILKIVNAGGIPPYIKHANGSVTWPDIGGFALGQGLAAETSYEESKLILAKGDIIILTSDGVVEANNAKGEIVGFEYLEETIANGPNDSAHAMLNHLKTTINAFVGKANPHDDLTIVVIQV